MKPNRQSIRLPGYDYASAGWYFVTMCCKDRTHLFGEIRDGEMVLNEAGELVKKWWNKIPEKFPEIELGEYQIMPNHFHAIVINVGADPRVGPEKHTISAQGKENKYPDSNSITVADPRASLAGRRVGSEKHTISTQGKENKYPDSNSIMVTDPYASLAGRRVGPEKHTISTQGKENKYPDSNSIMVTDPCAGTKEKSEPSNQGEHTGSPLHRVIQWFKTMTTNEFIRNVKNHGWEPFENKIWQRNYYEHIIRNEESHRKIATYIQNNPANWQEDEFYR